MNRPARTLSLLAATGLAVAGIALLSGLGRSGAPNAAPSVPAASMESFPAGAVGSYAADKVHSNVLFRIKHANVANFYGRFNSMDGSFVLAENPAESTFAFTIDTTSVDTNNASRDDHLRSPDFFNVEQFSEASFQSTGIVPSSDGPHQLSGELTLNGVTQPITADLTFTGTGTFRNKEVAGFEAVFTINRSEFGISTYLGPLSDEVTITVAVEGVKQ